MVGVTVQLVGRQVIALTAMGIPLLVVAVP